MKTGTFLLLLAGLCFGVLFSVLRLADVDPVRDLRLAYFDYLQRLLPRQASDVPVRVIDIDEASLAAEGQWPWPRDRLADLQLRLVEAGAAVIVYDVLFAEPDRLSPSRLLARDGLQNLSATELPDTDQIFAESLALVPTVLGTARTGEPGRAMEPRTGIVQVGNMPQDGLPVADGFTGFAPYLAEAAAGIGSISIHSSDAGGTVRGLPLAWSGPGGVVPGLSTEALRLAFGASTLTLYGAGDLAASLEGIAVGDVFVPTTSAGELWLYYRPDDPGLYLSANVVLDADMASWADAVAGHIVLIGMSAAGLLDIRNTALGEAVPGVSIHAQAIEQMLTGEFLRRSDFVAGLEVVAVFALVAAVGIAIAFSGPFLAVGTGAVGIVAAFGGSWLAFSRTGILFDAAFPVVAAALTFLLLGAYRLVVVDRERRAIRRSFSHYVAPEVLAEVERQGHRLTMDGETRDVTVLFSDIRGFTPLAETLSAEDLVSLLNDLFDRFGREIMAERGTIDKFIGDAVMAFWNAPLDVADHPGRAVTAALRMRGALAAFNRGRTQPIRTAIGIATGPVSVGNIGSQNRFNYSVVGPTVNLAARVEAACRDVETDILVSQDVAEAAPDLAYLDAGALALKGLSDRTRLFAVLGGPDLAQSEAFVALKAAQSEWLHAVRGGDPTVDLAPLASAAETVAPGFGAFIHSMAMRIDDYR